MQTYRELIVWQKAMDLVVEVYRITRAFPKNELYGLAAQMQRASVSIPSNIAEGHSLRKSKAYGRHLSLASGSLAELETQLEISERLGFLSADDRAVIAKANEIGRMLTGLRQSILLKA